MAETLSVGQLLPNRFEPKRQFRWVFEFAGLPQFLVTKVNKPSYDVNSIDHSFLDYKFN